MRREEQPLRFHLWGKRAPSPDRVPNPPAASALRTPISIAGSYAAPFAMMGHHEMNGSLTSPGAYAGLHNIPPQMSAAAAAAAAYGRSPMVSFGAVRSTFSSFSRSRWGGGWWWWGLICVSCETGAPHHLELATVEGCWAWRCLHMGDAHVPPHWGLSFPPCLGSVRCAAPFPLLSLTTQSYALRQNAGKTRRKMVPLMQRWGVLQLGCWAGLACSCPRGLGNSLGRVSVSHAGPCRPETFIIS